MGAAATTAPVVRKPGKSISWRGKSEGKFLTGEQTESLFHTYSQFASTPNLPQKPSEEEQRTEAQIQDLLDKVSLSAENMCFMYVDC
jgi:hypothetical protein